MRVAVVTSYGQVGRAIHEIFVGRTPWEEDREQQPHAEVIRIGRLAIPRLLDRIPVDGDRTVVTEICHVINDMMRLCGPSFVPQASLQRLGELLLSLLKKVLLGLLFYYCSSDVNCVHVVRCLCGLW